MLALLGAATLCAVAFIASTRSTGCRTRRSCSDSRSASRSPSSRPRCIVIANRLVVTEELEEDYPPPEHPARAGGARRSSSSESGDRISRKRLLTLGRRAARAARSARRCSSRPSRSARCSTPRPLYEHALAARPPARRRDRHAASAPTRSRRRPSTRRTPRAPSREEVGAPLVVVRLDPKLLGCRTAAARLGAATGSWPTRRSARTRAARSPSTARRSSRRRSRSPALVCPCHYSTFDPATGGTVIFGPAGRPLPQLPLAVDARGYLRAGRRLLGAGRPVVVGRAAARARA